MIKFKEEVLKEGVVVHCRTEKQAINLLAWADSRGYRWCSYDHYTGETKWNRYKEKTAYRVRGVSYSPVDFYRQEGVKILSYEEALLKEEIMKRGDLVYVSDRSVEHALQVKEKRIFLADVGGVSPIVCVCTGHEGVFQDGEYLCTIWKYAVPVPEEKSVPEYTMEELTEKLGHEFKLVKGDTE